MHADELEIDEGLVRRLLASQFPEWAELPLSPVEHAGTENAVFRLGDDLAVRLARRKGSKQPGGKEIEWLPRLAPLLPLEIPVPVVQGQPTAEYPWYWGVHAWVDGETASAEQIDAIQAARDLATFITALQQPTRPARRGGAGSHWPTATRTSGNGWPGSPATPP
jgi:aminoglycoside phosphotransferase (APT) family kinase protein